MRKIFHLLLSLFVFLPFISLRAQNVGIGTSSPLASAQLDITSTTKGLLVPRMTSVQRTAITAPANGLLVFDITTNSLWHYDGTAWREILNSLKNLWESTVGSGIRNSGLGNVLISNFGGVIPTAQLDITKLTASTNTIEDMMSFQRLSSGTPGNGIGAGLTFLIHSNGGFYTLNSRISGLWEDVSALKAAIQFETFHSGGLDKVMYINDKVGIGTTFPTRKLEVNDNSGPSNSGGAIQVGRPNSGADPKRIYFGDGDYCSVGEEFIDDYLTFKGSKFTFNVTPGFGTGNLGIGVSDPSRKLEVAGDAYFSHTVSGAVSTGGYDSHSIYNTDNRTGSGLGATDALTVYVDGSSTASKTAVNGYASGGAVGTSIFGIFGNVNPFSPGSKYAGYFNGNVTVTGVFSNPSDQKFKNTIQPLDAALNKIMLLQPSSYLFDQTQYKACNFPAGKQFGFTAQNVQAVFPELVKQEMMPDLYAADNERKKIKDAESFLSVNYLGLIPILTKAIQEQQDIIQHQNKKIEALEARLQVIEEKMK